MKAEDGSFFSQMLHIIYPSFLIMDIVLRRTKNKNKDGDIKWKYKKWLEAQKSVKYPFAQDVKPTCLSNIALI